MDWCLDCDCRLLLNKTKEIMLYYVVSLSTEIQAIENMVKVIICFTSLLFTYNAPKVRGPASMHYFNTSDA